MLKNYLKITLRTLRKHKGFSIINITGLAVGLAACILILLYVQDELSYDRYHKNADEIYRVALDAVVGGQFIKTANTAVPLGPTFLEEFPEVVGYVRFRDTRSLLIGYQDKAFYETGFMWADSTVFEIFDFPLVVGDARTALTQPNTIVLTQEMARKYFGDDDPLGKTLRLDNHYDYTVTGLLADIRSTSHFRFDFLGSFGSLPDSQSPIWLSNSFQTYLLLQEGADPAQLETKIPALIRKYVAPQVEQALGVSFDEALAAGTKWGYFLTPLTDIYLHSEVSDELGATSDIAYVYILSIIAAVILLIACINFINLSTARSANRAREVGMRKVLGSTRKQLVWQFLGESVLIALLALGLALLLAELALPAFRAVSGKAIPGGVLIDLSVVGTMAGIALLVGLLAGLYPAFVLSAFQPAAVLKGSLSAGAKNARLRNVLVVAQFAISIALLVCTGVVSNQLDFMQNKRMGFNGEQVVVLPIETDEARESFEAFRQELLAHSGVINAVASSVVPGRFNNNTAFRPEGVPNEKIYLMSEAKVSYDFLETFEMDLIAGRNFSREFQTDAGEAYIINEAAAHELGLDVETAPGSGLYKFAPTDDEPFKGTIIGVVRDFHFESLHQAIRPMIMGMQPYLSAYRYVSVRIQPDDVAGTLAFLEKQWKAFEPGFPYRYFFLDEDFRRLYEKEQRLGQIFGYFTLLAILVACLGLFGLASFITEQRTKEIGVRKVLGASAVGIVVMLSKEFTKLVLIASVVAFPIAYFLARYLLQDFAYRVEISAGLFLAAGLAALVIAWLTVSYQAIRAAMSDPVKALRYE